MAFATLAQLTRQSGLPAWDTVWAEDGAYLSDALHHDVVPTLFKPYAGYLQFGCRLLALPARWLPVEWAAGYLAAAAALSTALLAAFVFWASRDVIGSRWWRLAVSAVTCLGPALRFEATANVANVLWPLLAAAFWAVLARSDRALHTVLRVAVVALAVLSNPVALTLVPLAAVVAWVRRAPPEALLVMTLVAGGALQLYMRTISEGRTVEGVNRVGDLAVTFPARVGGMLLLGYDGAQDLWRETSGTVVVMGAVGLGIVAVLVWRTGPGVRRLTAMAAAFYALAFFVVPLWLRGTTTARLSGQRFLAASRYDVAPAVLIVSALAIALSGPLGDRGRRALTARRVARGVGLAWVAVVLVLSWRGPTPRSVGPSWSAGLDKGRAQCQGPSPVPDGIVGVTHPPYPPWVAAVDCGRLD